MIRKITYLILPFLLTSLLISFLENYKKRDIEYKRLFEEFIFRVSNESESKAYYKQKANSSQTSTYSEKMDNEFVVAVGDLHHCVGAAYVTDPFGITNLGLFYTHPGLSIDRNALSDYHK